MKKSSTLILALCMLFSANLTGQAEEITVTLTQNEGIKIDDDSKGHRMPPRPISCYIDSDTGTVSFSKEIADVISYEVWDENATICHASYTEEASFCEHMFAIPGDYQIRIVTEDYIYIGYVLTL